MTECKQTVRIGDTMSEWTQIHPGVPQGSILGPCFLIFS